MLRVDVLLCVSFFLCIVCVYAWILCISFRMCISVIASVYMFCCVLMEIFILFYHFLYIFFSFILFIFLFGIGISVLLAVHIGGRVFSCICVYVYAYACVLKRVNFSISFFIYFISSWEIKQLSSPREFRLVTEVQEKFACGNSWKKYFFSLLSSPCLPLVLD